MDFRRRSIADLTLNDEIIAVFRDILELVDDEKISAFVADILSDHQIYLARWKSEFEPGMIHIPESSRQRTVAWAYLHCKISALFEYARRETDSVVFDEANKMIWFSLRQCTPLGTARDQYSAEVGLYARRLARIYNAPIETGAA